MELAAIGDALASRGTVTLAGDHRRINDETAWFTGWAAARAELRRSKWRRGHAGGSLPLRPTIAAVQNRRKAPHGGGWDETVIQAMYQIVETRYPANGAKIVQLASVTDGFKELASEGASRPWTIWNLTDNADWGILEASFKPHASWTGQPFTRLVFYEGRYFQTRRRRRRTRTSTWTRTARTSRWSRRCRRPARSRRRS